MLSFREELVVLDFEGFVGGFSQALFEVIFDDHGASVADFGHHDSGLLLHGLSHLYVY